ncbi:MAG: mannose-1-phosphate guanylyltransferase/mannose-6-phosphate isomerase [Nitrosomonas sp.]|nr:mannose-1-phosphate guanylyltransferase/mannose-6-phosphate isomerase [Nitrosomonas sp.]
MTTQDLILIPTILCGGAGSRLWPVSREQHPKPFIRLADGNSLLQKAFLRGALLPNVSDIMTVTNREFFFKIEDEYSEINQQLENPVDTSFILEPFGRNTAPAIAAACLQVAETHGGEAILLVLAADHLISDQQAFINAVTKACELAKDGKLVTFGIQPTAPETGYGYIESNGHEVIRFVEKPSLDKAQDYLNSGNFLWNSGIFCFSVETMLKEMAEHCPKILKTTKYCMQQARKSSGNSFMQIEFIPENFAKIPDDSIDYAVMEKTSNAAVVACDIGWNDIGCWRALGDLTAPDSNNNRIVGDVLIQNSRNCTIKSENRVVGAVGIDNLVIIDTPDALLVANKKCAQEVKQVYAQLKMNDHEAHKLHRTVHRPWGAYTILEEEKYFKIKRIEVKPGASISLQLHHYRSEHWVVINGTAKVLNDIEELILSANESTFIPAKHKHRLENIGTDLLVIIEVQTGSYLGEDDIVRFQDIYGRAPCETAIVS